MTCAVEVEVSDLDDPRVALFRDVRDADLRGRDNVFLLESARVIRRALCSGCKPTQYLVTREQADILRSQINQYTPEAPVFTAARELITGISGYAVHGGALAVALRPASCEVEFEHVVEALQRKNTFIVIAVEGITNVDNMGALFRNAAAFGVDCVLLAPDCCDPLFRKSIRVSTGHALTVPFTEVSNWPAALHELAASIDASTIGAEVAERAEPIWAVPRSPRTILVLGSEGHGLTDETMNVCEHICNIPMQNDVSSLNVAVASAVCLYELRRGGN